MTGRVLDFVKSSHRRTQELLPWFLNGTLEGDEAHQVEEHLRGCPACRAELECMNVLRSDYVESELAPEAQEAFDRLRPRLLDEPAPASRPRRIAPRAAPRRTPVPAWATARLAPIPIWVKLALTAQFTLIFALGWQVLQTDRSPTAFHTLAQAGAPEHAAGSLVVVFDPNASQRDVARILHGCGGRVVDGPTTPSNGYVLAVPDGSLNVALTRLRAEPAVVLAEPMRLETTR
jgi:anti-sigma factor RsiW